MTNQEWLNQNALRNYPFKEDMVLNPTVGGLLATEIRIPNSLIVDFVITIPGSATNRIYLSTLTLVGNLLTFVFSDESDVQVAIVTIDLDTHVTNQAYTIAGSGTYDDTIGRLVIGDLSRLDVDLAEGQYTFTLTTAEFEPCTIRPALRGVQSLVIESDGITSAKLYGHLKFLAGSNVRLTYLPAYNTIRVDAISGEGLNQKCPCESTMAETNIVRTVNGIAIEDVVIEGDGQCVDVKVSGNKVVISDTCSTPCCGCPELEFLTESMKVLEATLSNLEAYSAKLAERINTFVTNYILTIAP